MDLVAAGTAGVATGHPLATAAGIDALAAGGSAADAVLAAGFTEWVVNAPLCGPGGELLALVVDGDEVTVYGGWSRTPLALDPGAELTGSGPRAAAVPGALRGAEALWKDRGRLRWRDLFAAGLEAAGGHEVTPRLGTVYELVGARGFDRALYRITGSIEPPRTGETIRLASLAESLAQIGADGADALYHGSLGDRVAAAAEHDGAWLRREDLRMIEARIDPAIRHDFDDITVWVPGPPSYAPITPVLLDRTPPGADPTQRSYAEALAPLIEQLLVELCVQGQAGTSVSAAVDADGVSVVLVHSLAGIQFGTGWVAGDTGIALSNRVGTALSNREDLPAANPRPGATLPHTLSAAHVRRNTEAGPSRWMTLATSGGDRQVQWLAQSIQRFRRHEATTGIVSGPRWFVCPEGDRFGVPAGIGRAWSAFAEPGIEWRDDARIAGYEVKRPDNVGGSLQIVVGMSVGTVELGSDPRAAGGARAVPARSDTGSGTGGDSCMST